MNADCHSESPLLATSSTTSRIAALTRIPQSAQNFSQVPKVSHEICTRKSTPATDTISAGGFAIGRFVGAFLMKFIRPRWVFLVFLTMCFVFCAPAATTYGGEAGMAMLFIVLFFESICFPTIVALGMRGLGKYSKRGSGFIVAGVSGGAVVPPILGASADAFDPRTNGRGTVRAMVVPTVFFIAAWSYALCVNFVKAYREPADKFHTTKVGIEDVGRAEDSDSSPAADTEKGALAQRQEGESPVGMKEVR